LGTDLKRQLPEWRFFRVKDAITVEIDCATENRWTVGNRGLLNQPSLLLLKIWGNSVGKETPAPESVFQGLCYYPASYQNLPIFGSVFTV
jgi:hypothetical protein